MSAPKPVWRQVLMPAFGTAHFNLQAEIALIGAHAGDPVRVQKTARQYVNPEDLVILVVGDPDQVQAGDGVHPIGLKDFGTITQLPPFTL